MTAEKSPRIYVAGHRGMVGSAIVRQLKTEGADDIVTRTHVELDLCDQAAVRAFFKAEKPDQINLAAAKVGGIRANNTYPAEIMPTNLYGSADNHHPENSHLIPGLIRRFHEAKINGTGTVTIWGTGTPRREFLYVDDMAAACIHVMNLPKATYDAHTKPMLSHINVGMGSDISIAELAHSIKKIVGYQGNIDFDTSKPDGVPQKWMNSERLNKLGWSAKIKLSDGLALAYKDFLKTHE